MKFVLDKKILRKKIASMNTRDKIEFHKHLVDLLMVKSDSIILDLGCGHGNTIQYLLPEIGCGGKIYGLDKDKELLAVTEHLYSEAATSGKLELIDFDLDKKLPFPEMSVDRIVNHNVLECIDDKLSFINDCYKVLKTGGVLVLSHTDWDSQIYNSSFDTLSRNLIHTYSDTTQDWMKRSDGSLARKLGGLFYRSAFKKSFVQKIFQTVNYDFKKNAYSYRIALDIMDVTRKNGIPEQDIQKWYSDLIEKHKRNDFYYSNLTNIIIAKK